MSRSSGGNLNLGSAVVQLLLPQRRPMLMVDFVRSFSEAPVPTLEAGRHISNNEVFFEGHFPDLPIWPGALTIEGLGQSASMLLVLTVTRQGLRSEGKDPDSILESLRNLDRGFRLHPGFRPSEVVGLRDALQPFRSRMAVGAAVDLKFKKPVFPGCRLDYTVRWTDTVGDLVRFSVEASVSGETVAVGSLTGAQVDAPIAPP